MLLPVVVVAENLGPQVGSLEHRAQVLDDRGLLPGRHVRSRITGGGAVLRLVLHGDRVDGDSAGPVGLDELQQVQGVGAVDAGIVDQPAADQGAGGLHPRGRTPRRGDDLQPGIESLRLAQQRQDLRLIVGDSEVPHVVVGLPGRQVVVGVRGRGDHVRAADRLAQVVQAIAGRGAEE